MNKKTIVTVLQILATLGVLVWLFHDPKQNREMWEAIQVADKRWILAGIVVLGVVEAFAITRWQLLLRVQGVTIGWWRLAKLVMMGLFFNPFMPGGTGGDVIKMFYVLKEAPGKKAGALLAVLMDRLVGLVALIVIATTVFVFRYDFLTQTKVTSGLFFTLVTIFVGSVTFIGGSFLLSALGLVHRLPERMPLRSKLVELSVAYAAYGKAWKATLLALLCSVPVHVGSFCLFYFAYRAYPSVGSHASMLDFWAIMPIVSTIAAIPVSIGGTGLREGLFIQLLGGLCDVPKSLAVIISLTGFMVQVIWGLVGGIIYLFYRPTQHASLSTIESEVAAEEQKVVDGDAPSRA